MLSREGTHDGHAPYMNFQGVRYSNAILASRHDLVGRRIHVINHFEDDARIALASTESGMSLGVLRAAPPWHRLPHTIVRAS